MFITFLYWFFKINFTLKFNCLLDDLAEKEQEEVTLHSVDAGALLQLIDYLYTGEILISEDNVQAGNIII